MSDDVRRKVETSLRAAADAVRDAQCALTSVAEGEHVVYGTRSKLCMALGLDVNASGIAIVDAVRAVIRERDEARAEARAAQRPRAPRAVGGGAMTRPTEYFEGEWRFPAAEGPEPCAVVTYAEEPSPETGHTGWCWWALGAMGDAPTYEAACAAAVAELQRRADGAR